MASTPYSRDTFSAFAKTRHYVGVRLKQGVPFVDADFNESDALRRYELRNFLRWFVGNGVPYQNDGFRIQASSVANDVMISGGNGTPEGAGRCIVDGLEVLNETTVAFSAQEFANAARAAAAGVPVVTLPSTPAGPRTDIYYLDVLEREITSTEAGHGDIVDPRIGIEAARRIRREWAVRVVDATTGVPADDTPPGHRYYPLASVARVGGVAVIPAAAITDLRRLNVTLISRGNIDQVTLDAFGVGYTLSPGGQPSLAMSLREVINAILKDGRPAVIGPATFQTANGPHSFPATIVDASGHQWVFWASGPTSQTVFFQEFVNGAWTAPVVAFSLTTSPRGMAAVGMPDGSIWVIYSRQVGTGAPILGRRWDGATWQPEQAVSTTTGVNDLPQVATTAAGVVMAVWRRIPTPGVNEIWSSVLSAGTWQPAVQVGTNTDPVPSGLGLTVDETGDFHVYTASTATAPADWPVATKRWHVGTWDLAFVASITTLPAKTFIDFSAIRDRFGGTWLIWITQGNGPDNVLRARRILGTDISNVFLWDTGSLGYPAPSRDSTDNAMLFYHAGAELRRIQLIFHV